MALFLAVLFFNLKSFGQNNTALFENEMLSADYTISQSAEILNTLESDIDSSAYHFGVQLAKSSWNKGIKDNDSSLSLLAKAIAHFANAHDDYNLIIEIFDEIISNENPNLLEAKLLSIKYYSYALNKLGRYKNSVEVLNYGIQCAKNTKYYNITSEFYHHLNYEYQYLSLIDKAFLNEYQRLNKKCIEYNLKLGNIEMAYIHSIQDLSKNQSKEERHDDFDLFLISIKKKGPKYHYLKQAAIIEYALLMIREHNYSECIHVLNSYHQDMKDYVPSLTNTLLAKSYLSLGNIDSGRYFTQIAKSHYFQSVDNDEKRLSVIFLADILGELEYFSDASLLKAEQYKFLKLQFVSEPITHIEKIRFARELEETRITSTLNQEANQFLIFCICLFITLVPLLVYSDSKIRSKNHIISRTINKLQAKNSELIIANNDLESYAYASAHDIRNPLSSIVYMLELLKSDNQNRFSNQTSNYINGVFSQINQIEKYIQGLLRYATINSTNFKKEEKIDLNKLINEVETAIKKDFMKYNYVIFIPDTFPIISGDKALLSELFLEVISNAIIFANSESQSVIHILPKLKGENLTIEIIDDGIGIPENVTNKVFRLFYRAHNAVNYPGVGVGLAIAKKITSLHNGKIKYKRNSEKGTTISITLPLN